MSRAAVQSYVQTRIGTIQVLPDAHVRAVLGRSQPDVPSTDIPVCTIEVTQPKSEQLTYDDPVSHSGTRHDTYIVRMRLFLGVPTSDPDVIEARQISYSEAFLRAFMPDYTLGGNCWRSYWREPSDNLRDAAYSNAGQNPWVEYSLEVTEQTTMGG